MGRHKGSTNRPKEVIAAEKLNKSKRKNGGAAANGAGGAPIGHNSELTEQEKQARLILGLETIEKFKKEADTANANARNERKRLATFGFAKEEVDYALWLRKVKESAAVDEHNKRMRIARFLNHPIGTQAELFEGQPLAETALQRAERLGYHAGLEGAELKPPYDTGSEEGQKWIEAYYRGAAARRETHVGAVAETAKGDEYDDSIEDAENAEGRAQFQDELKGGVKAGEEHIKAVAAELNKPAGEGNGGATAETKAAT